MTTVPRSSTGARQFRLARSNVAVAVLLLPLLVTALPGHAQTPSPQLSVGIEAPHHIGGMFFDPDATSVTVTLDSGGNGTIDHSWLVSGGTPDSGEDFWNVAPDGPGGYFELMSPFGCPDALGISPGDVVTATAGTTTAQHTVIDFAVTTVEVDVATISGTAPYETGIGVFAHSYTNPDGEPYVRWPMANMDDDWVADFDTIPDTQMGEIGQVPSFKGGDHFNILAFDEHGHVTGIHRTIPEEPEPPDVYAVTAPVDPVEVHTESTLCAEFRDSSLDDSHTMTIDWGDGTSDDLDLVTPGPTKVTHTYTQAGIYTPAVTVTDSTFESDTMWFDYLVVYDPDGGFVTGSGWFDSPEGAYQADDSLVGRAHFGFVSRYHRGATVPDGRAEFRLEVAELDFRSTSHDWLVVAGDSTAKFKGIGTINRAGEYKFQIWAVDGAPDALRIRIWAEDAGTETVIYDNGDQPTELGAGAIVVHR